MNYLEDVLFTKESYNLLFGTPPDVPLYLRDETINGKYIVKGMLSGGMNSEVYIATDALNGEEVTVKFVKGDPRREETLVRQSNGLKELRKWSALPVHPNILPMYDTFYDTRIQKFAIVTPYISATHPMGLSLRELIDKGYPFSSKDVEHMFCQVYKTICYIMKKTRILYTHCDFKPDNLFVISDGSEDFCKCSIMIADCGSYSTDCRYTGNYDSLEFSYLAPEQRDLVMLLETGEAMKSGYRKSDTAFSAFCAELTEDTEDKSILDFEEYFGMPDDEDNCDDALKNLLASYWEFSFAHGMDTVNGIKRSPRIVNRFNASAQKYGRAFSDSILPAFLAVKDSQAVGNYTDATKRIELIRNMPGYGKPNVADKFCEYSVGLLNEIDIRYAVSRFYTTDLYEASDSKLKLLCGLFEKLDVSECFNFSWMDETVWLCEYMAIVKKDTSLLEEMCRRAEELKVYDSDSTQIQNEKKLFKNVFLCMATPQKSVKSECAKVCTDMALAEPYNVRYLYYGAKTLMLSGCITAAQVFCIALINQVNQTIKHPIPTASASWVFFPVMCLYWLTAFPADRVPQYTHNLEKMLDLYIDMGEKVLKNPTSKKLFYKLKNHIYAESQREKITDINACLDAINSKKSIGNYAYEKIRQYGLGMLCDLQNSAEKALEAYSDTENNPFSNPRNRQAFLELLDILKWTDATLPALSSFMAWAHYKTGDNTEALALFRDAHLKMMFSVAQNPYFKTDEDSNGLKPIDVLTLENNRIHDAHIENMDKFYTGLYALLEGE